MMYCRRKFLVFGHRGASQGLPENTLEAFELALKEGADAIETDLRRTLDGKFVLAHDATGDRMCGQNQRVCSTSWEELSRWNAGARFLGSQSGAQVFRIPLLREALSAFPSVQFNIDIKERGQEPFLPDLIQEIREVGAENRVLLTSFHSRIVGELRRLGYRGELGMGLADVGRLRLLPASYWRAWGPKCHRVQIPVAYGLLRLDSKRFIAKCHGLGLKVDYWVINDPLEAKRLFELGADGIMSDVPGIIRASQGKW